MKATCQLPESEAWMVKDKEEDATLLPCASHGGTRFARCKASLMTQGHRVICPSAVSSLSQTEKYLIALSRQPITPITKISIPLAWETSSKSSSQTAQHRPKCS